jgi:hypothetical protein
MLSGQRQQEESRPVDRQPTTGASIQPGWPGRVESSQYWIHLTLCQAINERWVEETGENWSRGGSSMMGSCNAVRPLRRRRI